MTDYENLTTVAAPAQVLFDYLAKIGNLPDYFPRMRVATPVAGGEAVYTEAELPDGRVVSGEAWFRVDREALRIEWGSQGPNDYHGELEVTPLDSECQVRVLISTARVESDEVEAGVDQTMARIKHSVETAPAEPPPQPGPSEMGATGSGRFS